MAKFISKVLFDIFAEVEKNDVFCVYLFKNLLCFLSKLTRKALLFGYIKVVFFFRRIVFLYLFGILVFCLSDAKVLHTCKNGFLYFFFLFHTIYHYLEIKIL